MHDASGYMILAHGGRHINEGAIEGFSVMKLVSVNIGAAESIDAKSGQSGINKRSVQDAVLDAGGMRGDAIVDTKHHGGVDQAVYVYTRADYAWWEAELGRDLPSCTFGENLTVNDWPAGDICVGDRLQIGEVLLEVTSPRIPCVTLEARMGLKGFAKTFLAARRPGPYLRVLKGGTISTRCHVTLIANASRKRLLDWPGLFAPRLQSRAEMLDWLSVPVHHFMRAELDAALHE